MEFHDPSLEFWADDAGSRAFHTIHPVKTYNLEIGLNCSTLLRWKLYDMM